MNLRRHSPAGVAAGQREVMLSLAGLDCPDCAAKIDRWVLAQPGVEKAEVSFASATMRVVFDESITSLDAILRAVAEVGYSAETLEEKTRHSEFRLRGLDCPDCAAKIEKAISALPGAKTAFVNFATSKLIVDHDEALLSVAAVEDAIGDLGYTAELTDTRLPRPVATPFWLRTPRALVTLAAGVLFILGLVLHVFYGEPSAIPLYALSLGVGGVYAARGAVSSIRARTTDMNVLMTVAAIGAALIGQWAESAAVMLLFGLGTTLEAYTIEKTRGAIRALIEFSPHEARVKTEHGERLLPVEEITVGAIVTVKPGEKIPLDGVVVAGESSVNQAPITGESLPAFKQPGDPVYAGTLNRDGYLEVRTEKPASDTTLSQIIHLVERAQGERAPSQRLVDRFAKYYTPAVIASAVLIAVLPPLLGYSFSTWFYRALVLLVIACPCALVISTPVAILSSIGAASHQGVLLKGGSHLETIAAAKAVIFDKTGTLTEGRPTVSDVIPFDRWTKGEVLALAASLETRSQHPLASAILHEARHERLEFVEPESFQSLPGQGVKAQINGSWFYLGNLGLFESLNLPIDGAGRTLEMLHSAGKTAAVLGTEGALVGIVAVADDLRAASRTTVRDLHRLGIERVAMLTGDNQAAARAIALELGIDDFRAELLPEQKLDAVREFQNAHGQVAMVGDGVNDAPALAAADVGIAMGAIGTGVALETADITLMADDLSRIPYIISLSRHALRIIKQNVAISLLVKAVFIVLGLFGLSTLWMAVLADDGVSLLVIGNGMRLFSRRPGRRRAARG